LSPLSPLRAQELPTGWATDLDLERDPATPAPDNSNNTTVIPRTDASPEAPANQGDQSLGKLHLSAFLSDAGQKITTGLVWRIFQQHADARGQPKLVSTHNTATPNVTLKPGKYIVNVAFGRAYRTETIDIKAGGITTEKFVLNAGGLKLLALVEGKKAPKNSVHYDVLEGEPDQSGERKITIANAKPGLIFRLNAGIYRIISRYGDANAKVSADVQVEAGKLTVATVSHSAAKVTFKLVDRPGGEALPGIQWSIATPEGKIVKKSVGALPTHILAPGTYTVTAVSSSETYQAEFSIEDGQMASVEVVMN